MLNQLMLVGGNWFLDIFKMFTHLLDQGIYFLAQCAYQVFYFIANATILNDTIVRNFTLRIYTLIGIVMVFVLAFNLLSYIVDPDKITDKKVGASSFVKDVILAIAIISLSPMLFTKLYSLQSAILTSGVIENLILGGTTDENFKTEDEWKNNQGSSKTYAEYMIANGGNNMVASVYVAFLYPADGSFTALDCGNSNHEKAATYADYCEAYQKVKEGESLSAFDDFITNEEYNFTPFLTTVAGIVLLFFMLSFCINLAKRVGKMAIVQLIAPVPVTLELLPNKKGLRDNWLKTLAKVYLEVFFYMAVMFLVILLISLVPGTIQTLLGNSGANTSTAGTAIFTTLTSGPVKLFATVILIYGLLMFGKEAPQMLFDLLGIKSTGIIKEAANRALIMAGSTKNALEAGGGNFIRGITENKGVGRVGGALFGAGSAITRNLWAGRNAKSWADTEKNRKQINEGITRRRINRQAYNFEHGGWAGGVAGHMSDGLGSMNKSFKSATSIALGYQKKKEQETVFRDLKEKANAGIMDIIKNDSTYQLLREEYLRTGSSTAKNNMEARVKELMKNNTSKLKVGFGEINGFVGSHQNVTGMSKTQLDPNKFIDASTGKFDATKMFKLDGSGNIEFDSEGNVSFNTDINDVVKGVDVKETYVDLTGTRVTKTDKVPTHRANDLEYQNQKARETINERVREEARKSAQDKQAENKPKN